MWQRAFTFHDLSVPASVVGLVDGEDVGARQRLLHFHLRLDHAILAATPKQNVPVSRNKKYPGVNFTNILCPAFTCADTKRAKNTVKLLRLFCAFGICACKNFK